MDKFIVIEKPEEIKKEKDNIFGFYLEEKYGGVVLRVRQLNKRGAYNSKDPFILFIKPNQPIQRHSYVWEGYGIPTDNHGRVEFT